MLTLFEELFVLAIHEEKGKVLRGLTENLGYGLGAGILAELALAGKIRAGESHRIGLADPEATGDELVDSVLKQIRSEERERKVTHWLRLINNSPEKLQKRVEERLAEKGVLRQEDTHFEWIIPYPECPKPVGSAKYWLKRRLRGLVLTCEEPEQRDLALLNLAYQCGLLEFIFVKDEIKLAKHRLYESTIGKAFDNPFMQTIEEIQTALEAFMEDD